MSRVSPVSRARSVTRARSVSRGRSVSRVRSASPARPVRPDRRASPDPRACRARRASRAGRPSPVTSPRPGGRGRSTRTARPARLRCRGRSRAGVHAGAAVRLGLREHGQDAAADLGSPDRRRRPRVLASTDPITISRGGRSSPNRGRAPAGALGQHENRATRVGVASDWFTAPRSPLRRPRWTEKSADSAAAWFACSRTQMITVPRRGVATGVHRPLRKPSSALPWRTK